MSIPPITESTTIDKSFYTEESNYEASIAALFCKSWQYIADAELIHRDIANVVPVTLLEKCIDEPLLITNVDSELTCMTNVCTHRAFKLVQHPTKTKKIVCGYHGRRFDLQGQMEHMPMFEGVKDFPRPCDHLHKLDLKQWQRFLFTCIDQAIDFEVIADQLNQRLGHMDMSTWRHAPEYSKTYAVKSNWALYIDNYLEGFHIPFVHDGLTKILDFGNYSTEVYDHMVLQIGYGKSGDPAIALPENHPDSDSVVTAYYYWIFPNFMLNIYNWGVQINIVKPIAHDYSKVEFEYYIADESLWEKFGRDGLAEKTEREDEYVVEAVQQGLKSRFYHNGQYSPKMEKGIHYFHHLLEKYLPHLAKT